MASRGRVDGGWWWFNSQGVNPNLLVAGPPWEAKGIVVALGSGVTRAIQCVDSC